MKRKNNKHMGFFFADAPPEQPKNIKHSFTDISHLLASKCDLDFLIVTGHSTAKGGEEQGIPKEARHVRGGNFCDLQFLPPLISHFTLELCKRCDSYPKAINLSTKVIPDIYLQLNEAKNHNLIVIGAGNVNWVAEYVFNKYWGKSELLPVHFKKVNSHEIIVSELSGKEYALSRTDKEIIDYGILEMVPNPWNEDKVIILSCGIDLWATQAGIVALFGGELKNNRFNNKYPAKVLRVTLQNDSITNFKGIQIERFISIKKDEIYFEE